MVQYPQKKRSPILDSQNVSCVLQTEAPEAINPATLTVLPVKHVVPNEGIVKSPMRILVTAIFPSSNEYTMFQLRAHRNTKSGFDPPPILFDYHLWFTNTEHYEYYFTDKTDEHYENNTYINRDDYISYNSNSPTIISITCA